MSRSTASTLVAELSGHSGSINCLKFGRFSSQRLATGGDDRKVFIWRLKNKGPSMVLSGHASPIESLEFHPNEEQVAGGASSGTIKLWDLAEGKVVRTLTGHRSSSVSLHFHPNNSILASGSVDSSTKIWDLRQRDCVNTLKGHLKGVSAVQFSPDGRWIASGGHEGAIQIWDVASAKRVVELGQRGEEVVPRAHDDRIFSLLFHPQELLLASASADKTCKLWDLETYGLVATLGQDGKALKSAAFSVDGSALFSSHADAVKVWGWEPTRCYDIVSMGSNTAMYTKGTSSGGPAADLCTSEDNLQLLGGVLGHGSVTIWNLDLSRVEPFGRNDVDEKDKAPASAGPAAPVDPTDLASSGNPSPRPATAPGGGRKKTGAGTSRTASTMPKETSLDGDKARRISDPIPSPGPEAQEPLRKPEGLNHIRVTLPADASEITSEADSGLGSIDTQQPLQHLSSPVQLPGDLLSPRSKEAMPDSLPEAKDRRRGQSGSGTRVLSRPDKSTICGGGIEEAGTQGTLIERKTSVAASEATRVRGLMSPQTKKSPAKSTLPRFLEPTAASRQRALANALESNAVGSARSKDTRDARDRTRPSCSPAIRPSVERRATDTGRRSPLRLSSVGPWVEQRRDGGDTLHAGADRTRQGVSSPKHRDSNHESSGTMVHRSGRRVPPSHTSNMSGGGQQAPATTRAAASRKPWAPAVIVKQSMKPQNTAEQQQSKAARPSQDAKSCVTSSAPDAPNSTTSSMPPGGTLLPSVLGQTAWTVPWASASSDGSASGHENVWVAGRDSLSDDSRSTKRDSAGSLMSYQDEHMDPARKQVGDDAGHPNWTATPVQLLHGDGAASGDACNSGCHVPSCSQERELAPSQGLDSCKGSEVQPALQRSMLPASLGTDGPVTCGSRVFGSPMQATESRTSAPTGMTNGVQRLDMRESTSPDQQVPIVSSHIASAPEGHGAPSSSAVTPGVPPTLPKISLTGMAATGTRPSTEAWEIPPAGPNTPVTPIQPLGSSVSSSRELSPLDPNTTSMPVSPLSSSGDLGPERLAHEAPNAGASVTRSRESAQKVAGESSSVSGAVLRSSNTQNTGRQHTHNAAQHGASKDASARAVSPNSRCRQAQAPLGHHQHFRTSEALLHDRKPDLRRASGGSGNFEQAMLHMPSQPSGLDFASFAAACNVSDDKQGDTARMGSEGSMDPDLVCTQMHEEHRTVLQALSVRRSRLQEAKLLWAGEEVQGMVKLLTSQQDKSVLVDILNIMVTSGPDASTSPQAGMQRNAASSRKAMKRWQSLGLSGCADLLPLLHDLLQAPYSSYVDTSLLALQDLLSCYGDTLKDIHSTTFAPGVDLHGEERKSHCQRCILSLRTTEGMLSDLSRKRQGSKHFLVNSLHTRVQEVLLGR